MDVADGGGAAVDAVMGALIDEHGPPRQLFSRRRGHSRFELLAESICYQQLAGKAAEAIWKRVVAACGGEVTPQAVLAVRTTGLNSTRDRTRCSWNINVKKHV